MLVWSTVTVMCAVALLALCANWSGSNLGGKQNTMLHITTTFQSIHYNRGQSKGSVDVEVPIIFVGRGTIVAGFSHSGMNAWDSDDGDEDLSEDQGQLVGTLSEDPPWHAIWLSCFPGVHCSECTTHLVLPPHDTWAAASLGLSNSVPQISLDCGKPEPPDKTHAGRGRSDSTLTGPSWLVVLNCCEAKVLTITPHCTGI